MIIEKRILQDDRALRSKIDHRAFSLALRELRMKLVMCKELLDDRKYRPAPNGRDIFFWSDYIDGLIDKIDFGGTAERYKLLALRKEVESIAEGLINSFRKDGCCRKKSVS